MALDPVPWLVGGGAEHSPAVARMLAYMATSGASGIGQPGDLRVTALPTPGGAVRVAPGAGVLANLYPGGGQQSYIARNISSTEATIPATGSSGGATRYLILRVDDPEYAGQAPADPKVGPYVRFVLVGSTNNLAYPNVVLAKIVQPANTATITQAMITDLREVANPLSSVTLRARPTVAAETETLTVTATKGEWFPNAGAEQTIFVPPWATRAIIEATWIQVREPGGNSAGECWVEFGPWLAAGERKYSTQRFDWNTHNGTDVARAVWEVADDRYIPAEMRGTDQIFVMKGRVSLASVPGARPQIDAKSGVKMRVTFLQVADPSTS